MNEMRRALALIGLVVCLVVSGDAVAQANSGSYEALSIANRRIVSALYEAQLGSRRDMAGHALLSKDEITAMRRAASWEEIHRRLALRGYVASQSLADAIRSYNHEPVTVASPVLIISTGGGDQVVVNRYKPPRSAASHPAQANIIPAPATVRPQITVVDLPVTTAAGHASPVDITDGVVAPAASAEIAGTSRASAR